MTLIKTCLALLTLVVISCNATSKVAKDDATNDANNIKMNSEKMLQDGFKMGTIIYSEVEGDCPYVIDIESDDYQYFLDPINLEESFKKNGEKIWFKFGGLRMPNRCEKANPINIIEIHKREE